MTIQEHTRLYEFLHREYDRCYQIGKTASGQECSVLTIAMKGIESALEVLDNMPIDLPGQPILEITVPDSSRF